MKIGTSQVSIMPPEPIMIGGMFKSYPAKWIHDPLYATCFVFDDGQIRTALVSCDLARLENSTVAYIRKQAEEKTGIKGNQIMISVTHTHGGPYTGPDTLFSPGFAGVVQWIADRIVLSIVEASQELETARIGIGKSTVENCAYNRRFIMSNGRSKMHAGGEPDALKVEGPEDKELLVAWFQSESGELLGVLTNYSSHPAMSYGGDYVSADYPGLMRTTIQSVFGRQVPVLFILGACGNVGVVNYKDPGWGKGLDGIKRIGRILGSEAIKIISSGHPAENDPPSLDVENLIIDIPYKSIPQNEIDEAFRKWELIKKMNQDEMDQISTPEKAMIVRIVQIVEDKKINPKIPVEISAVRIGDLYIVTHPVGIFVEFQLDLKERFRGKNIIFADKTNGQLEYVPTRLACALGGYEVLQGRFIPEAGDRILEASIKLIEKLSAHYEAGKQ